MCRKHNTPLLTKTVHDSCKEVYYLVYDFLLTIKLCLIYKITDTKETLYQSLIGKYVLSRCVCVCVNTVFGH